MCIFRKYECSKVHTIIQQFQAPCHPFHTAGSVAWLPPSDSESHYWTRPERREGHGALLCWMAGWLGLQPAVTLIGGFKVWNVDGVDFCRMSWKQPDLLRLLSAIRILKPSCLVLSTASLPSQTITIPDDTLKSPLCLLLRGQETHWHLFRTEPYATLGNSSLSGTLGRQQRTRITCFSCLVVSRCPFNVKVGHHINMHWFLSTPKTEAER